MGLSRRRRARKSASTRAASASLQPLNQGDGPVRFKNGNTMRRTHRINKEMRNCGIVSFEVSPYDSKRYCREPTKRLISKPNANHSELDRICLADNDYDFRVAYSLNKKSRWDMQDQIANQCNSGDRSLRNYSLALLDTEWRPQGRGKLATRRLATNFDYMRLAANELRSRLNSESKLRGGKVSFSSQVEHARQARALVSFGGHRGQVNRESMLRAFEMPKSELEDAETLRLDSDRRTEVLVEIRKPTGGAANKIPHSRLIDDSCHSRACGRQRRRLNCRGQALIEDDYCDFNSVDYEDSADESEADESFDELTASDRSAAPTVFDAMRVKPGSQSSVNGKPLLPFEVEPEGTTEQDDWILVAEDDQAAEEVTAPGALSGHIDSVLLQKRPILNVKSHLVLPERLEWIFAGTDALCMSSSQPRKFAVLLQENLCESVAFEVISEANGFTKLSMRHIVAAANSDSMRHRRISAAKLANKSDPFEYLRGLLTPGPTSTRGLVVYQPQYGQVPVGWCRTEVWNETDARVAAIRALPMFSASATVTLEDSIDSAGIECGICNNLMRTSSAAKFSKRSTALGGCRHRFCNACWVRHVTTALSAGAASVECPSSGCRTPLDGAVLLWFCPDRLLPALAGAAFRAWQRRLPVSRFCPLPRCGRLLVAADNGGKSALCCCWTSFCLACGKEPHWPVDCATAERYLSEMAVKGHANLRSRELFAVMSVRGKRCPGCQTLVEKTDGCNHMSCACGHEFCWNCGDDYDSDHVCGESRVTFIRKKFFAEDDLLAPTSERSLIYCTAIRVRRARHEGPRLLEGQAHLTARLLTTVGRSAANAEQLIADVLVASYLLEYTCVLLDANEANDAWQSEVRVIGERIQQLTRSFNDELQSEGRGIGDLNDKKMAEQVVDSLVEQHEQLVTECQRLRSIVNKFGGQFRAR
ncbi:hypothetical protein BOX15_Mlig019714g1 [Macrostomum lignano]|uniref:RBR-type E3 ubiquitin transferase n=1 Tax=Macrostomum lignano TaxID=282301 RepID=A0A267EMX0_9PLAT|nr:hypothetical protein BOX15_Mlig019714g1 [Macrostomum lignano]